MIDISLEAKERKLLDLMHPHGCSARCLLQTGKAKAGEIPALVDRGLCQAGPQGGTYELTDGGRIAIGAMQAPKIAGGAS